MTSWIWLCLLVVMVTSVAETLSQCSSPCDSYRFHTFPTAIDNTIHHFTLEVATNGNLSENASLFSTNDAAAGDSSCSNHPAAMCSLHVIENNGGIFRGNFTCTELESVRGDSVMFTLDLSSGDQVVCSVQKETFVYGKNSTVTQLSARILSGVICKVTLEGCFPPCCGGEGNITEVHFGDLYRYNRVQIVKQCRVISFALATGDSSNIFDENLALSLRTVSPAATIDIDSADFDNLQYCFNSCRKNINLLNDLRAFMNHTKGCFSINATLSPPEGSMVQLNYETLFTYCTERQLDNVLQIECVGFNPEDQFAKEMIFLKIFHTGNCNREYNLELGEPVMVPCMDKRCQRIESFNLDYCLSLCLEHVAGDDETVDLCETVAEYALQSPVLTSNNVSVVLQILVALSNTSGSRQLAALSMILDDLVNKLQTEEGIYLVSVETGNILLSIIDHVLVTSVDNSSSTIVALAPFLLENLEGITRVISMAIKEDILSSNYEYAGRNAILYLSVTRITDGDDYLFPNSKLIEDKTCPVKLWIPRDLLCKPMSESLSDCPSVVASVITRNLPQYLDDFRTQDGTQVNTLLLSTTIDSSVNYRQHISQTPITISFSPLSSNITNETCVFWDPKGRIWSSTGVITTAPTRPGGNIICTTTHLTSFAVLVNPKSYETTAEIKALGIVTYIGCGISLACLLASLLVFFTFQKSLNKGVLLYIHINFSISLSLALAFFVAGIESAASHALICTIVAAVLHYLFLSVFCWMLAEGIMLYLLVVRVFGSGTDKWYYLLLLGWGCPLPVVAVSLGLRHGEYGTENYCWLSHSKGSFWAFLGPIIFIIMTNCIILVLTVGSMIRSRRKFIGSKDSKNWRLALTAVKSTIILLPLLGLAWIIGPFTLFHSTSILSWIFAILNSLQGLFFFILHVLRNDKVYDTMKKILRCIPATVMEKPYNLRGLSSNITLASAESVATASTSGEGLSQLDCERVASPPFNIRIFQRKTSEGSAISLGHPTVSVFNK